MITLNITKQSCKVKMILDYRLLKKWSLFCKSGEITT